MFSECGSFWPSSRLVVPFKCLYPSEVLLQCSSAFCRTSVGVVLDLFLLQVRTHHDVNSEINRKYSKMTASRIKFNRIYENS